MLNNFLSKYPDEKVLLDQYPEINILEVNGHLHTPYSFSAFESIPQMFSLAKKEEVDVLGINDFFVTDGYSEFSEEAIKSRIFPLFNIEFIGLLKEEQKQQIRVNDPNNPGRCYFSGKGLDFPFHLNKSHNDQLRQILVESQEQVKEMVARANSWFGQTGVDIKLDYDKIRSEFAREMVRERHIAKAIRVYIYEKAQSEDEKYSLLTQIFGGKEVRSDLQDHPGIENEIRGNLLKAGGKAFVEEDENAFMSVDEIIKLLLDAGGIPCYPVLLDDKNGNYTEYEEDPEKLWKELSKRNIGCIELIPGRNDADHLKSFVEYFNRKDFVILFGTEHNTPELISLKCDTRGKKELDESIRNVSYEGACVVAAHQYLRAKGHKGFTSGEGLPANNQKNRFIRLGNAVINYTLDHTK